MTQHPETIEPDDTTQHAASMQQHRVVERVLLEDVRGSHTTGVALSHGNQ